MRSLAFIWRGGWLPFDLWEIIRRRADAAITSLLVDTIAADTAQYASQMVHERWAAQVQQLDAESGGSATAPTCCSGRGTTS